MYNYPEDEFDWSKDYQLKNNKKMTWKPIVSAVVSAVLVAVLMYVLKVGDVWAINTHEIVNIAVLTGAASLLKWLGTTTDGNFLGVVSVK